MHVPVVLVLILAALASGCGSEPEDPPVADAPDTAPDRVDADGDGFTTATDCDDADPTVNPTAMDACGDGVDSNCDGAAPDCALRGEYWIDDNTGWLIAHSSEAYGYAGWSLAGGDVTGDGRPDLIMGAPDALDGAGQVYVLHGGQELDGRSMTVLMNSPTLLTGDTPDDEVGYAVAFAGDVNGDGVGDVLVGASSANRAWLFFGPLAAVESVTAADATLVGEADGDYAGFSVAPAGDVNHDGFDDILIGAPAAGRAYLVHGPVEGTISLAGADARFIGQDYPDATGWSVASGGDVDGDGERDFLIGAPRDWYAGVEAGAVFVVRGPVTGDIDLLTQSTAYIHGDTPVDMAGRTLASAGDFDGDGLDDILIGARGFDDGGDARGAAYVVYAPFEGPVDLATTGVRITGANDGDYLGQSVAALGDVSGDGLSDLLVAGHGCDPEEMNWAGCAYIFYGPLDSNRSVVDADVTFLGEYPEIGLGYSAVAPGDLDGDGANDIVIGAPMLAGSAYVVYMPVVGM